MIQSVTFINRFGRSLHCILREPEQTNIAITKITGLGPGAAAINVHGITTADGGYFGSARFDKRIIELDLRFLEWSMDGGYVPIEKTRLLSYEFFAPKTRMLIIIETDERTLQIEGYVETNEPDIFNQTETTHISIVCPGYYFKMVNDNGTKQTESIYGNGLFTFPFSNESTTKKLIEFGFVSSVQTYSLFYSGDMESGFDITITFDGDQVTTIIIQNEPKGNSDKGPVGFITERDAERSIYDWSDDELSHKYVKIMIAEVATKLSGRLSGNVYARGNKIVISSKVGKKSAMLYTFDRQSYNIIDAINHLEWLKVYPGYNEFTVTTDSNGTGHFDAVVEYESLFTGV